MKKIWIYFGRGENDKGVLGMGQAATADEVLGMAYRNFKAKNPDEPIASLHAHEAPMNSMARILEEGIVLLAQEFSHELQGELSHNIFKVIDRNRHEPHSTSCHSHDFLDANEVMAKAFKSVMGREIDLQSDFDKWIWGLAWGHAKVNAFFIPKDELPPVGPRLVTDALQKRGFKFDPEDGWRSTNVPGYFVGYIKKGGTGYFVSASSCTGSWVVEVCKQHKSFTVDDKNAE